MVNARCEDEGPLPLIVLCGHRSGSSAFMGLLADMGLNVGALLPPAPDNPKGFIENRAVVEINRRLLFERDRDWTCPPSSLNHRTVDREPLERVGVELGSGRSPWGFKDPRTLFTATAWAAAVGPCRLVGVHRNTDSIARSLADRNDFSIDQARNIALAYAERLAEAHRRLGFPIVSFDSPTDVFLQRTATIVQLLGLEWDEERARGRYDPNLIHQSLDVEPTDPFDAYLADAGRSQFEGIRPFTPATVVRTWEALPSERARSLPRHLGPRYSLQRTELLTEAEQLLPEVSGLLLVEPEERTVHVRNASIQSITLEKLIASDDRAESHAARRWSHVVGPFLLDRVSPGDLNQVLAYLKRHMDSRSIAAIGGWIIDADHLPTAHDFRFAEEIAQRTHPPYLHHLDELLTTLLIVGLFPAGITHTTGGRTQVLITNDRLLRADDVMPSSLRRLLPDTRKTVEELRSRLDQVRANASEANAQGEHLRNLLDKTIEERDEIRGLLHKERTLRTEEQHQADHEIEQLQEKLAGAERAAAKAQRELATESTQRQRAEQAAARSRRTLERLSNRRIVRVALGLARPFRPLFRFVRRQPLRIQPRTRLTKPLKSVEQPGPRRTQNEIVRFVRSRSTTPPESGPKVSIIILTRNGAHHLTRLLPLLETTAYDDYEVVVVDNGSTDATAEVLSRKWSFPLSVVHNESNTSFSEGNNVGAARATGDLLLFMNNDIEPIETHWLGSMVSALQEDDHRVAVGAVLVYPDMGESERSLTVQHAGIDLTWRDGAPHAVNVSGPDPMDEALTETREVSAATAALLMVRRQAFEHVGGFHPGYVYGAEDVDLCLQLRRLGSIVVAGNAMLFHHESASQRAETSDLIRINRINNWQLFAERWGARMRRSMLEYCLNGPHTSEETNKPTVAITLTHNDPSRGWGDYYTAHELGDALERMGWRVLYAERRGDLWYELEPETDLVISLLDAFDVRRAPTNAFTIAWVRNWVDRWIQQPWFESFDLVTASSHRAAVEIAERTRYDPPVIPLATNPERFAPGAPVPTFKADYAFTGNNWGAGRELVPLLDVQPHERFLLFGKGWDAEPRVARYWRGHLDYELLPDLYRSVRIVLDDTAGPTLPHGFLNGRVFDALASGALVLTDNIAGSREMFDEELPTYSSRSELRSQLDRFLSDEQLRNQTVKRLRTRVLQAHTYDGVASRFIAEARSSIELPTVAFKIGVPREEEREHWGDTHFARGMASALARQGFPSQVHILPEWDRPDRQDCDIVIHLRGLTTYAPKPSHLNVLWIISHPDDLTPRECDKYDIVLVASRLFATKLQRMTDRPVVFMPQATDGNRFHPVEPSEEMAEDLLFVGNSRGQVRQGVTWAVEQDLPLAVYGQGWEELLPAGTLRADHFSNEQLASLYASARVVLNDHWPDMREQGFVSNRIFDVLASGGVVVSDDVAGLDQLFGDLVPKYRSSEELDSVVRELLEDPRRRSRIGTEGSALIAREHTFSRRAEELADLLWTYLSGRPKNLDGDTF